jgi:predicted nucleic acid-binding protein
VSWLLDADVLCQPVKKHGDRHVIAWLQTRKDDCYKSSIVIAQLALWVRSKRGKQRTALQKWLGRPMPVEESYIAAIARRHNLIVATGNSKDFRRPGIKVHNPFREEGV